MFGAILGDIIGSRFEFDKSEKTKDFELITKDNCFTDDTVMTIAIAEALLQVGIDASADIIEKECIDSMRKWGSKYPYAGYGPKFAKWLQSDKPEPYGSFGNGSAMRVSAAGWLYDSIERTREVARATAVVTHDHPEGIKGAECTAAVIFLARNGASKTEIAEYVEREFGYDYSETLDEMHARSKRLTATCQDSLPKALRCFFDGNSYEEVVRYAVYLGGDTDTNAAIAGSMAEAFFWEFDDNRLALECFDHTENDMHEVMEEFDYYIRERGWKEYKRDRAQMLSDFKEWKKLDSLRTVGQDLSGMHYSKTYAKEHKNMRSWYSAVGDKSIGIEEAVHIRKDSDGEIYYQVVGRDMEDKSVRYFNTQYGVFHSEDNGEFGGELTTPGGNKIGGHYEYIFDLHDKVYAISSFSHLMIGQVSIRRFDNDTDSECIYSAGFGNYMGRLMRDEEVKTEENFSCDAVDIKEDVAYVALSGVIRSDAQEPYIKVFRLIRIKNGNAEVIKEFTGKIPSHINSIIVDGNKLYISCDKMVCISDLGSSGNSTGTVYLTCVSREDEKNLLETERIHYEKNSDS